MTDLLFLAYHYGFGGGGGMHRGITHLVVSTIIRSVIFGFVFRIIRQITLAEAAVLAVVVVAGIYAWSRWRNRIF